MKKVFFLLITFYSFSQDISNYNDSIRIDFSNYYLNNAKSQTIKNSNDLYYNELINSKYNKKNLYVLNPTLYMNFNSNVPYSRNDGSMIPNVGFQQLLSFGFYFEYGPLSIQINPEYLYAENKPFQLYWTDHQLFQLDRRYDFWNKVDLPERFGQTSYSKLLPGQSSIRFNFSNMSIGFSTENLWWGPGIRNAIMLSNNARGFPHITFNSVEPLQTKIGNFEWQLITGRLEKSGFLPSYTNFYNYNDYFYLPKKNDWRYFQGLIISYSPSFIKGLTVGFSRWVQAYSTFIKDTKDYFPVLDGLFRKNDKYGADIPGGDQSLEQQRDQAAGVFFRWVWNDAKAEIYGEYFTDYVKGIFSKRIKNNEDLKGYTLGFRKVFNNKYDFSWEWTNLSQDLTSLKNNSNIIYTNDQVRHGYTNYGEVLGATIGPGSSSQSLSIGFLKNKIFKKLGFELTSINNDWFIKSFESAKDYRRYWKEFYIHTKFSKRISKISMSSQLSFGRILNYQWELEDFGDEYYKAGKDINNFKFSLSIMYNLN